MEQFLSLWPVASRLLSQVLASDANLLLRFEALSSYLLLLHLEFLGFLSQIRWWFGMICDLLIIWVWCFSFPWFVIDDLCCGFQNGWIAELLTLWQSKVQRSTQSTRRSLAQHRYCHCWSFCGIYLFSFKASKTRIEALSRLSLSLYIYIYVYNYVYMVPCPVLPPPPPPPMVWVPPPSPHTSCILHTPL